jgi:hypothetical protein
VSVSSAPRRSNPVKAGPKLSYTTSYSIVKRRFASSSNSVDDIELDALPDLALFDQVEADAAEPIIEEAEVELPPWFVDAPRTS